MPVSTFEEPQIDAVQQMLDACLGKRIAVVGDLMLDAYIVGKVARISPEAPVPVLNVENEQAMLGGAANVGKALVALGAEVQLVGIVGNDADGELLAREAKQLGIHTTGLVVDKTRPTTRKTRIVAQRQQVIRLDHEQSHAVAGEAQTQLIKRVEQAAKWADAIVISDYAKGVLTPTVSRKLMAAAKGKPTVVDPKDLPWSHWKGATVLKPNKPETAVFTGQTVTDEATAEKAGRSMLRKLNVNAVLLTRGSQGMTLIQSVKQKNKATTQVTHLPARQRQVFDVTGAGDVVAATLTLALAAGASMPHAMWLSNVAAGIKVGKFGAATVTGQEILEELSRDGFEHSRKVMTRSQAAAWAQKLRQQGKQIVFTNGCFDILHVGHVRYLEASRRQGDAMIVGINTDASIRKLKGEGRPIQSEADRAHILASQSCVDAVVLFDEDTPLELIKAVKPNVLTKGADYKRKQDIVGWDIVEKAGGKVVRVPLVQGKSTTRLIALANK